MNRIFQPLLFLLARSSEETLRHQVEFLKCENEMLRKRVPKQRIFLKDDERARLLTPAWHWGPASATSSRSSITPPFAAGFDGRGVTRRPIR